MVHHRRGLRRLLRDDPELADRIAADHRTAGLDERRLALLDYADKLTGEPWAMTAEDVDRLRAVGFDDADVLAIVEVVGYYAYANRVADGLGVELEDDRD